MYQKGLEPHLKYQNLSVTIAVSAILLLAIINSGYLLYLHYLNYTDIAFSSFCALSKSINCDTVAQSSWSIFLGLPVALWGLFAYFFYLIVFIAAVRSRDPKQSIWYLLFWLSLAFSISSVILGYISATKIKAYCILCIFSYSINLLLFFCCFLIIKKNSGNSIIGGSINGIKIAVKSKVFQLCTVTIVLGVMLSVVCYPKYWHFPYQLNSETVETGITEEGNPWIGTDNPKIIIHEYADYQCFQCSKMHLFLRQLITEHPDKIQLIHHHYPMDHEFNAVIVPEPYHIGSGKMALLAIQSVPLNKFWEVNDALYKIAAEKKSFNVKRLAEMTDVPAQVLAAGLDSPVVRKRLQIDIWQGMQLNITGTPTYVIDGKTYVGTIPRTILNSIIE